MNQKAQASVEFIIVLCLLFGVLLFSTAVFSERQSTLVLVKENYDSQLIANDLARTINAVHLAGHGSTAKILLMQSFDYNVGFSGNIVRVNWKSNFASAPLLTTSTNFVSASPGRFVKITNNNGVIRIENS